MADQKLPIVRPDAIISLMSERKSEGELLSSESSHPRVRIARGVVLACFAALSLTVVITIAWNSFFNDAIWSGAVGFVLDSMQYLAWVREGSEHLFSANLFTLSPPVRDYINPALLLSSVLHLSGVSIPIAYALWVPIGIALLIWIVPKYVSSHIGRGWPFVFALALALMYKLPAAEVLETIVPRKNSNALLYGGFDSWPVYWSWGFSLTAVAVALLIFGLLRYAKERATGRRLSTALVATAIACSWLQPWQGAILIAVVVSGELLSSRFDQGASLQLSRSRLWLAASTAVAGVIPLAYYAVLGRLDQSWLANGDQANDYVSGTSWWTPLALFGPLLMAALFACRRRPTSFSEWAIRLWPLIAILELFAIAVTGVGNTATHALKGITIPLAILAVIGARSLFQRRSPLFRIALAVFCVLVLIVPGSIVQVNRQLKEMKIEAANGYFISPGERDALNYIADSRLQGSVLGGQLYSSMVPWRSGRQVWVGHETWTPQYRERAYFAEVLLNGDLPGAVFPVDPGQFAQSLGVRFVLVDCQHNNLRLLRQLRPYAVSIKQFGCAAVVEIRPDRKVNLPAAIARYRLQ